ncbi:synaptic vesicular amine transporter [Trichuris trichiura]|uniref:Synaptic vesicular amine transporter n=1 Tax=Trichuris trichiura TaxID=36087 RepID=A0A077Z7V5_TRITR|nr:synaptic vesicular amine transporter [Trichuris trichiura]
MPNYLFQLERKPLKVPKSNESALHRTNKYNAAKANASNWEHLILVEENVRIGLIIGYTIPMFSGFVVMFFATATFAFGKSYSLLFFARSLQGVGSACTSTAGMGMLAEVYPDDQERGAAMGFALGGLALGVLVGPPFGGVMYKCCGKETPFLLLAIMSLCEGIFQLVVLQPKVSQAQLKSSSFKALLTDRYILISGGAITIGNLGIAMLEPTLPLWMMDTMRATPATIGAAFLPASLSYLVGTNIFGPLAYRIGRWLSALIGLITIGSCLFAIPQSKNVYQLIIPTGCMGLAIGMIDASMFPHMGHIVDKRHSGIYGGVYAIADAAFCLAYAFGPVFGGPLIRSIGFPTMLYLVAILNFVYAPFLVILRRMPEAVDETTSAVSICIFEFAYVFFRHITFSYCYFFR